MSGRNSFHYEACPASTACYVDFVAKLPENSDQIVPAARGAACACGPWWKLPLLLALVLVAILLFINRGVREEDAGESRNPASKVPAEVEASETVSLTIDFGDGREKQSVIVGWHEGMTVRDLMNSAPQLSVSQQGSAAAAFLTAIDGVANEGAGGRNWLYSVGGKRADRSFAVYGLRPGDHVLWTFAPPE
jgi:hypothetical protein